MALYLITVVLFAVCALAYVKVRRQRKAGAQGQASQAAAGQPAR